MKLENTDTYIFDLDDTLYDSDRFAWEGMRSVCEFLAEKYKEDFDKIFSACIKIHERDVRAKVFNELCEEFGFDEDIAALVKIYRETKPTLTLYEDAGEILSHLKDRGFKTGVITDGVALVQGNKVEALKLYSRVDAVILTDTLKDETGHSLSKPDVRVYEECLKSLGSKPDTAVYIGDNPNKDFIGARKLGMKTVRIKRDKGMFMNDEMPADYEADITISSLRELI